MEKISNLIQRCLVHQVKIYPYQLDRVMASYSRYKIPDSILNCFYADKLEKYIEGLYLSGCEGAGDWTRGHEILKSLGFVETRRSEGHRSFVGLEWPEEEQPQ